MANVPELVTILNYNGPTEDPVIAPNGEILFFDSFYSTASESALMWARRIDYKTFIYIGPVNGINQSGQFTLRGNIDIDGNLFFTSNGMVQGVFNEGFVFERGPVQGIMPLPNVNFILDVCINAAGNVLFFTEGILDTLTGVVSASQIAAALKNPDGSFTRLPIGEAMIANVNATSHIVYDSAPSPDGLAFVFTAQIPPPTGPGPVIFIASRASTTEPFGIPQPLLEVNDNLPGSFSESGGFSPDSQHFYFHRVLSDTTNQLYVINTSDFI